MDSSRRCRFLDFPAHFALFLAPRQALISGESSSRFAGSEAVRLKPGESRNHEGNLSAGSSTNLRAALCREWKNRSTPKRQIPRNLPARGRPARRKPPNPWENETIKANTVVLAITLLAAASSGDPAPNTWLSPAFRIIDNQGTGIIESPRGGARVPRRLVGAASLVDP